MPFPYRKISQALTNGDAAASTAQRGAALEDVVTLTLCSVPGLRVLKRNFTDAQGSAEIDLVLYNDSRATIVPFLTEYIIVECKNWQVPVNSATVRDFIGKLRSCKRKVGILIAANGVTHDENDIKHAEDTIRQAFDAEEIILLVMTREHIESFRSTDEVVALLRDKFGDAILRSFKISD